MALRVYLLDDQLEVLTKVEGILHREPTRFEVVGAETSGRRALEALRHTHVDVLLLDMSMPRMNGVEVIARLRERDDRIRIVALTSYEDSFWLAGALSSGADGYILKTASPELLMAALENALLGTFLADPRLISKLADSQPGESKISPFANLTSHEIDILGWVAQGRTNSEIAAIRHVSVAAVKATVASLMVKLKARNRTHMAAMAAGGGLLDSQG